MKKGKREAENEIDKLLMSRKKHHKNKKPITLSKLASTCDEDKAKVIATSSTNDHDSASDEPLAKKLPLNASAAASRKDDSSTSEDDSSSSAEEEDTAVSKKEISSSSSEDDGSSAEDAFVSKMEESSSSSEDDSTSISKLEESSSSSEDDSTFISKLEESSEDDSTSVSKLEESSSSSGDDSTSVSKLEESSSSSEDDSTSASKMEESSSSSEDDCTSVSKLEESSSSSENNSTSVSKLEESVFSSEDDSTSVSKLKESSSSSEDVINVNIYKGDDAASKTEECSGKDDHETTKLKKTPDSDEVNHSDVEKGKDVVVSKRNIDTCGEEEIYCREEPWKENETEFLIAILYVELVIHQKDVNQMDWEVIVQKLYHQTLKQTSVAEVQTLYKKFRDETKQFMELLQVTGYEWNPNNNEVTCKDDLWEHIYRIHGGEKTFRKKGLLHYNLLREIFRSG